MQTLSEYMERCQWKMEVESARSLCDYRVNVSLPIHILGKLFSHTCAIVSSNCEVTTILHHRNLINVSKYNLCLIFHEIKCTGSMNIVMLMVRNCSCLKHLFHFSGPVTSHKLEGRWQRVYRKGCASVSAVLSSSNK